jgi:hypothetical protein
VDTSRGAGYGNTLTWRETDKPRRALQKVEIQMDLDRARFEALFTQLMTAPVTSGTSPH